MADFVPVGKTNELKPGEVKRVMVDGQRVCLANTGGEFFAIKDQCGHQKAALTKGKLEGDAVECPLHFARFDVRSGKALNGPDFARLAIPGMENLGPAFMEVMQRTGEIINDVEVEDVPCYEVRVDGDTVLVKL